MSASFVSCVAEMAPITDEAIIPVETVKIRAVIQDSNTKVILGESIEGKTKVEWADEDSFVLTVEGTDYTFVRAENGGAIEAEFIYDGQNGLFPKTFSAGTITAKYPADVPATYTSQTGTQESIGQYMTMSATETVTEGQKSEELILNFRHTSSVVRIALTNEAFKNKSVQVYLSAEGLLDNGNKVTTSAVMANSDGTATAYIGIPVTGDKRTLTNCKIGGFCEDILYSTSLGNTDFIPGKMYKVSKSNLEIVDYEVADDGTYTVYTANGLYEWRKSVESNTSTSLILGKDIIMQEVADGESNWTPIESYSGIIDGKGRSIKGLVINNKEGTRVALVNNLESDGIIKNLSMTDGCITTTKNCAAGIVAVNYGTIVNCRNENDVRGYREGPISATIGGIAGLNGGEGSTIIACSNTGNLTGDIVGGIVGQSDGIVVASYNTGTLTGGSGWNPDVGGIVARNYDGSILSCYNSGIISNNTGESGGIVSESSGGSISNCYFSGEIENPFYESSASITNVEKISDGNWTSAKDKMNLFLSQAGYLWEYIYGTSSEPLKLNTTTSAM